MLTKELNEGFKDLDTTQGIVTGYFAMFGNKDLDGDIIEPGAFSKTIQERGPKGKGLIKYLLDHDKNKAVAVINELYEDGKGLYYEAKVGSHMVGKDFLEMVKSGIINQHSFGFSVPKDKSYFDQSRKANIIKEVMMYEGSAIQFLGANPETTHIGLKSFEDYLKSLEKFIQTSEASDDCIIQIESLLKTLKPDVTTLNEKKADQNKQLIEHLKNSLETWKTN